MFADKVLAAVVVQKMFVFSEEGLDDFRLEFRENLVLRNKLTLGHA